MRTQPQTQRPCVLAASGVVGGRAHAATRRLGGCFADAAAAPGGGIRPGSTCEGLRAGASSSVAGEGAVTLEQALSIHSAPLVGCRTVVEVRICLIMSLSLLPPAA